MKKISWSMLAVITAILAFIWIEPSESNSSHYSELSEPMATVQGRLEHELMRLADPVTGKIPEGMRMKELAFASTLPSYSAQRGELSVDFESIGPYNVGGRTRAFAIDRTNNETFLAGGVSGGMWKSVDAGSSWYRVTEMEDHAAVSCVSQDPREGKNNIWYYGSGEVIGNSASKSFSAYYRGNGIYKSTDNGETWVSIQSTQALQHKPSDWDGVFRILVDPTREDSTILLAAIGKGIMRSNDDGATWKAVLGGDLNALFTDLIVTTDGVYYATISDNQSNTEGFFRSSDGLNWTDITPQGIPGNLARTVMAIPEVNENIVYFFSGTPGGGTNGYMLWRYEYISGDGSGNGGSWENRSDGLPYEAMSLQGGYSQALAVKPDNPDVVFIGGTNLYRSTNGFIDTNATIHVGGYRVFGDTNYTYRSGVHYPDQQRMIFDPEDPMRMYSTTDGGIHMVENCLQDTMQWISLSRGYVTAQFYAMGIDHGTPGSREVMGGLQDRGTFWTNKSDPNENWVSIRGADGAYVHIEDGGEHVYMSTQYANIQRANVDEEGNVSNSITVMPEQLEPRGSGNGWLFVHPFAIDPADNNIMYLPNEGDLWRNTNLAAADDSDLTHWSVVNSTQGTITAIAASKNPQGIVYWGTSNKRIYKMENGHLNNATIAEEISDSITNGGYTSCIAIDPNDANKVIVVYSNYSTISLWYTEDGGKDWTDIEGNLRGNPDPGVPEQLSYIGDGPSIRWAEICPTPEGNVYFLGTSVGVFSTREINGDSTVWKQEAADVIGNVVVDMLDYRESDGWLVVSTHGNGMYAGTVEFVTPAGVEPKSMLEASKVNLFPNPSSDRINLEWISSTDGSVEIQLFDQSARLLQAERITVTNGAKNRHQLNLSNQAAGVYFISIKDGKSTVYRKVIKE